MNNLHYEKAEKGHAKLLTGLYNAAFYDDYIRYGECPAYGRSIERMEQSIERFPKWIVYQDNTPIGVISYENRGDGIFYIGCLCIIPEYQGRGIGTAVIKHFCSLVHWKKILLITPADKKQNLAFYTKCGFVPGEKRMDGSVEVIELVKINHFFYREIFRNTYFLKEELVSFCKEHALPTLGSKIELAEQIEYYLDTGKVLPKRRTKSKPKPDIPDVITTDTLIEANFVCSEKHRAFFKEHIGKGFSFQVAFQKWLKANAGKSYQDAICAYYQILEEKKHSKTKIDKQFEYNTYIRDFFADNKGKPLEEAIRCWKYKKQKPGHNRYEQSDIKMAMEESHEDEG